MSADVKNFWTKLTVDTDDASTMLRIAQKVNKTVMLWGKPGIGKTSIVYQLGEELRKTNPKFLDVVVINPSQTDIIDLKLPHLVKLENGEVVNKFAFSDMLPREGEGILFVDEINTAPESLQPTLYSLILEGRIGNYKLPPNWMRVAAGNREEDGCAAQPMSAALRDRLTVHMCVEPSERAWLSWAATHGIRPEIQAWVKNNPTVLVGHSKDDPTGGCTPRSLEGLSRMLDEFERSNITGRLESILLNGSIGQGAASEFEGFLQIYRANVDIDNILKDPLGAPVYTKPDIAYSIAYSLSAKIDKKNFSTIMKYLDRMHKTYKVVCITTAQQRNPELERIPEFHCFLVENINILH